METNNDDILPGSKPDYGRPENPIMEGLLLAQPVGSYLRELFGVHGYLDPSAVAPTAILQPHELMRDNWPHRRAVAAQPMPSGSIPVTTLVVKRRR